MSFWDEIISGIIKNFSPIIAALITAIIAGVSAYTAWRAYRNSYEGTPPNLLKYEKWLDEVEKRKSLADDRKIKLSEEREQDFLKALDVYEINAIWESKVLSGTPVGKPRKLLLKTSPQVGLRKNVPQGTYVVSSNIAYVIIFIIMHILILLILLIPYINIHKEMQSQQLILLDFIGWNLLIVPIAFLSQCTTHMTDVYRREIADDPVLPGFIDIILRYRYIVTRPQYEANDIFPNINNKRYKFCYFLRDIIYFIVILTHWWCYILYAGLLFYTFAMVNNFSFKVGDFECKLPNCIPNYLSWYIFIFCLFSILVFIFVGIFNYCSLNKYLSKSELKIANGQWEYDSKKLSIENGVIKIEDSKENSKEDSKTRKTKEKILSVRQMRRILKSKKTKFFKGVKFISRNHSSNSTSSSIFKSSSLTIELEGNEMSFQPKEQNPEYHI